MSRGERCDWLLVTRNGPVARNPVARNKKRRHLLRGNAAGISHQRGSWLACRREILLNLLSPSTFEPIAYTGLPEGMSHTAKD